MNPLLPTFEASRAAALQALARVSPQAYAVSRNHLLGAATALSPYFTHGLLTQREVFDFLHQRSPLHPQHKLVYEFGWRAYFRHVWAQLGDGILESLHPGPLPDAAYHPELPEDVRQARSGVPAIDQAVRCLYASGHLHNHARMWLASYLVHVRKVAWRVGADWLYGHLLDGDLASNHLSWQWVAGTGSHKPYLFNAENVARFAPPEWHSPGSVIDTSYEALDALAHTPEAIAPSPKGRPGGGLAEPPLRSTPPDVVPWPDTDLTGRPVWLQHPWALGPRPAEVPQDAVVLGLVLRDCHQRHPWSGRRWQFVLDGWRTQGTPCWCVDAAGLGRALAGAASVWLQDEPHLRPWRAALPPHTHWLPEVPLFAEVPGHQASFSRWWQRTRLL
ncbi:MAG: FAD-binding domain-containing protein [Hydrogenophaga sp.]|nr:FAD-binding domain-containing protein [Hydrogenophaga sp.]